jgi:trehalose/maltose transport system substrate-binding protein
VFLPKHSSTNPSQLLTAIFLGWIALFIGCRRPPPPHVTITFLDSEFSSENRKNRSSLIPAALQEFTRQTGIEVRHLPAPEGSQDQLALTRHLLQQGTEAPDVYAIDVVWPGALEQYFIDLNPYFAKDLKAEDPVLVANYTVQNRLVAVPYHTNVGILWYRTDLLRKYGFQNPPKTWDELEKMALRIQIGERAAGNPQFWGYVWPGSADESLTCNALEWQVAEGGGHIVESDGKISVNNPSAIHAWQRAAHWVGWISPPGTLSYREWDSINIFKTAENSAFMRTWASDYFISVPNQYPVNKKAGVTSLPGPGVLGGSGLAISRMSAHQPEAIKLVQFLRNRELQLDEARAHTKPIDGPVLYNLPSILKAYASSSRAPGEVPSQVVARPSTITGADYGEVSRAYFETVYSVLSKQNKAEHAASHLEDELTSKINGRLETEAIKAAAKN